MYVPPRSREFKPLSDPGILPDTDVLAGMVGAEEDEVEVPSLSLPTGLPGWYAGAMGAVAVAAALVLVLGWGLGEDAVTRIHPSFAAMAPSTATGFLVLSCGILGWMLVGGVPFAMHAIRATALIVGLAAAVNLGVIVSGRASGVDALLFPDTPLLGVTHMSAATSVCFFLSALALFRLPGEGKRDLLFVISASSVLAIALLALIAYVFDASSLYAVSVFAGMAAHTAAGFVLISGFLLLCRPNIGWVGLLAGEGRGSVRARRMLPVMLGAPLALTMGAYWAVRMGLLEVNFALSLLAVSMMALLGAMAVREAVLGNKAQRVSIEAAKRHERDKLTERALLANQARFRAMTDALPVGIYQAGDDGRMSFVNKAFCELFGFPPSQILGDAWMKSLADVEPFRGEHVWQGFRNPGDRKDFEFRFRRRDGSQIWIRSVKAAIFDDEGGIAGYIGAALDVTAHRHALEGLKQSERRFQALSCLSPAGIFRTGRDGACVYVNEAWLSLTGMEKDDAMGHGWRRALHPRDRERVEREWETAYRKCSPFRMRYRIVRPDGRVLEVISLATPEPGETGAVLGYVGVVIETSDFKAMEARERAG